MVGRKRVTILAAIALAIAACTTNTAATTTSVDIADTTTTSTVPTTTTIVNQPPPSLSGGGDTSLLDAAPVGRTVEVGDWRIRVTSVTPDATALLLEDEFNDPPGPGKQFFMAAIEATYTGDEIGDFFFDITLSAVGDTAVAYQSFDDHCGFVPNEVNQAGRAFPGGTLFGNVCWNIESTDQESMVLIAEEFFGFDENRAFLSMDPGAAVLEDSTSTGPAVVDTSDALSFGGTGTTGMWEIRVLDVVADATDLIAAEASFNEPPTDGHQFYLVTLEATYVGDESSSFFLDMTWESVGSEGVIYSVFNADCGFIPDGISFAGEAFPGGTVTGNVCWEIRQADADSLVMMLSEFTFNDSVPTMFQLGN